MGRRQLHLRIRRYIERAMAGMSLRQLADRSSVPYATLHDQMSKPRFSVEVLAKVSRVLDLDVRVLLDPTALDDT